MNLEDYKLILEKVVHKLLYENSVLNEDEKRDIKSIKNYIKESNTPLEDIRFLCSTRNNENYFAYDRYISKFIRCSSKKVKFEVLNNQDKYSDLIKNEQLYIEIWRSLECEDKIEYLNKKKKLTSIDIMLLNDSLKDCGRFKNNALLEELLDNENLRKKLEPGSIHLNYTYSILSMINLADENFCYVLTKESFTKLLLKKCKTFNEFIELYNANKKIYFFIKSNGLIFDSSYNKDIYEFILKEPSFIGKFDYRYLDLFSITEIEKMKQETLDADAYSTVLQATYRNNEYMANDLFTEENLKKCSKGSIIVNPFNKLDEDIKKKIFGNYNLLNRFVDSIIIEAIESDFSEEDVVNSLRDDNFVDDMSPYAMQLLLNKLSFKATFNVLQREKILSNICNLNVKVRVEDSIFFKGFLDSPVLIHKSEHTMVYEMLDLLNKEDVLYYIELPYILDSLSNYEIVNLVKNKDISILEIIDYPEIQNKLNIVDIATIIDNGFEKNIDLSIFKNRMIVKDLFSLDDSQLDSIDFDEVNYLFETIRMKSILSKREEKVTVLSYKAVLASYLLLGLDGTIDMVSNGNMNITLDEALKLKNEIVDERLLLFKEKNSDIFQNMGKKIVDNLTQIGYVKDLNDLSIQVKKNTYLDNITYLMLENGYDSYNNIIDKFFNYINYSKMDVLEAKKRIYDYAQEFASLYINNKASSYSDDFDKVILMNFRPKENVLYRKRKECAKDYLDKLKFKLFVKTLTDPNKETYSNYYRDNYPVYNIKDKYTRYLANSNSIDFEQLLHHVLIPIENDRFDKENCLSKLGINKPENTDIYLKHLDNENKIAVLNKRIEKLKTRLDNLKILEVLNYICYGTELSFNIRKSLRIELLKYANIVSDINGEIYIDKKNLVLLYKDNLDIYNINEIIEYHNYMDILDGIITKTFAYINRNMDNDKIKNCFAHDYMKHINNSRFNFPITNKYYEPKKHVLALKDLEKIFNGYDVIEAKKITNDLYNFLFNKKSLIMFVDGYYDGVVDSLGIIISKWQKIIDYARKEKISKKNLSLIRAENIMNQIIAKDNVTISLEKDIIKHVYEDGYYEVNNINKRIDMLTNLYQESFKVVDSCIPYISYRNEKYKIETLDGYNHDAFRNLGDPFKVGGLGNDFLHYSILDKCGMQIGIYEDDKLIAKILGVRNGNTLYLNALDGICDVEHHSLLRLFANEMLKITENTVEPINFVTIVNNSNYESRNGYRIDPVLCERINDPIDKYSTDFGEFTKNSNLLNPYGMYTNYNDSIKTLLASNKVVDKDNFKFYYPTDTYNRIRSGAIKLSNNIGEEYQNRISTILQLCKIENDKIDIDINLENINTIFLGDDYVVLLDNKENILEYVLPYDDRARNEVNIIKGIIKKTN